MTDPFDLLGREIARAAARRDRPRRAGWLRARRRVLLTALGGAGGASAVAFAATTVFSPGAPVGLRYGAPATPDAHFGVVVAGSVRMLADDVADPAGGLPWGLRSFTTSRGFGCLQVGRVQDGRLGVLALQRRDGGVVGRGLFHELRPAVTTFGTTTCVPLDGAGHAFVALHDQTSTDGVPPKCGYRTGEAVPQVQRCRDPDERTVDAGLLGPEATSVSYRDTAGRVRTVPTLGGIGGYLVVQHTPVPPSVAVKLGGRVVRSVANANARASSPAGLPLVRVDYRDGSSCAVRDDVSDDHGSCPDPPGFVPVPQPRVADVSTPVTAFATPDRRAVRLRFTARVAVRDGRSAYDVLIRFPGGHQALGMELDRDIAAGQHVHTTLTIPNVGLQHRPGLKRGRYQAVVSYRVRARHPGVSGGLQSPGDRVGTASFVVRR